MTRRVTENTYVIRGEGGRRIRDLLAPTWLEEVVSAIPSGTDAGDLNEPYLREVFARHGTGYPGPDVLFPNGYDAIFDALSGDYEVRLSSPVAQISVAGEGATVRLRDGEELAADAVLVTVPLGVLKAGTIAFEPELSAAKRAAIERMGMGVLDKLYLRFDQAFWDDAAVIFTPENGLPRGHFNYWVNVHKYVGEPILLAFNAGSVARELATQEDREILDMAERTLRGAYPG